MHGWANRILRIDLSNTRIEVQEAEPYLPEYLGGRGMAARICWQEYAEPVEPFASSNPLMVFGSGGCRFSRCAAKLRRWAAHFNSFKEYPIEA